MHLKCNKRVKDGKEHRYWSLVESRRCGKRVVQRQLLYLGEINSSQKEAWRRTIEVLDEQDRAKQLSMFPDDRPVPGGDETVVQVCLNKLQVSMPRQFGACWLFTRIWDMLDLDRFWSGRLPDSREGTNWRHILKILTAYQLIQGGSEWSLHKDWYHRSAMGYLLGEDTHVVQKDKLYRCLDKLVEHKEDLFKYLKRRWESLFGAEFDVLLYDLTSTYFEIEPPTSGKRRYGYSRDKRNDCVQVVIALIVTPAGLPLAYEVMPGNTADCTTLSQFLDQIERIYGKANRTWIMDRGIPTEEVLARMRKQGVRYLVGTPKGRLTKLAREFADQDWQAVRDQVQVKLHSSGDELYVLVKSARRVDKEKAIRKRRLKSYWKRLKALSQMKRLSRDQLLMKLGAAKQNAGQAAGLVKVTTPKPHQTVTPRTFHFELDKDKLRERISREGKYLLRSNLVSHDPGALWENYMLLSQIEQAFRELKHDLSIRPIYHQLERRIDAHIFVAFMAYCVHVTLKNLLKQKAATGLTPRAVLDKMAEIQLVNVEVPTVDGDLIIMPRYTRPQPEHQLILSLLGLQLPKQPTPRIEPPATPRPPGSPVPRGIPAIINNLHPKRQAMSLRHRRFAPGRGDFYISPKHLCAPSRIRPP